MALKRADYAGLGEYNCEVVNVCVGRRHVVGDGGVEVTDTRRDIKVEG
jgi:hypothetical protein